MSRRARLLLVDDSSTLREALREALEQHGILVIGEAGDGAAAVQQARALRPDVVLLDVSMPVRDGLDALPDILGAAPGVHVVVLTANRSRHLAERALALGAAAYVEKGSAIETIVAALRPHTGA